MNKGVPIDLECPFFSVYRTLYEVLVEIQQEIAYIRISKSGLRGLD